MTELKSCPFCGGEARTCGPYGWYRQWGISHNCRAFYNGAAEAFQGFPTEAAAIAAWNRRAPVRSDRAEALATALRSALHFMRNAGANIDRDYPEIPAALAALSAFEEPDNG